MTSKEENGVPSRFDIEDLLYHEAALLDAWRLDDWFALFAAGATYEMPPAGADENVNSATMLFYIADDYERLRHRVERLKDPDAHAEFPRSHCHRLISNVRLVGSTEYGLKVTTAFITQRSKMDITDTFYGHHHYVIQQAEEGSKFISKRTILSMSSLRPQGRISIIV